MNDPSSAPLPSTGDPVRTHDGHRLFTREWRPSRRPRSIVVIVHGLAEHSGRYEHVARFLVRRGHAVYAYDQRGHGRSEGRRAYVQSFDEYLDDLDLVLSTVRSEGKGQPLILFGHSMGGAVVALHTAERASGVAGLILSSPALRVSKHVAPLLQRLSGIIGHLLPRLPTVKVDLTALSRDPKVVAHAKLDPLYYRGRIPARTSAELIRAGRRIQNCMESLSLPVLLIHGTDDRLTDPTGSSELYRRARSTDKTLGVYPGFYHETFNEPEKEQVLDQIATWLDEHT